MKAWPIVGHQWAVRLLRHGVANDEIPHALLITGPESVGKHTLAEQVVAAILCAEDERPCGHCLSCRKLRSGNHPDFRLVAPEDRTTALKIEQIREIERFLTLTPKESLRKVVLIQDFERATVGAANALLKTLEEPPSYAHLFLLATDADLLLPTIVSRAQQIVLRPLPSGDIAAALMERWQVDPARAERLARISGGRMGWAVQAATNPDHYERMKAALTSLTTVLQQDLPARFEMAQQLSRDAANLMETLEHWLTFWRDVLLVQADSAEALTYTDQHQMLRILAETLAIQETVHILERLDQAQQALGNNANPQLLVENLLLDLPTLHAT